MSRSWRCNSRSGGLEGLERDGFYIMYHHFIYVFHSIVLLFEGFLTYLARFLLMILSHLSQVLLAKAKDFGAQQKEQECIGCRAS